MDRREEFRRLSIQTNKADHFPINGDGSANTRAQPLGGFEPLPTWVGMSVTHYNRLPGLHHLPQIGRFCDWKPNFQYLFVETMHLITLRTGYPGYLVLNKHDRRSVVWHDPPGCRENMVQNFSVVQRAAESFGGIPQGFCQGALLTLSGLSAFSLGNVIYKSVP